MNWGPIETTGFGADGEREVGVKRTPLGEVGGRDWGREDEEGRDKGVGGEMGGRGAGGGLSPGARLTWSKIQSTAKERSSDAERGEEGERGSWSLQLGEATKMGIGSSRSSVVGEMNLRRIWALRRWRVKLRVWRRYLPTSSGSRALAEAPALEIWSRTGIAAGPQAPKVSTTIGTKPRPFARHSSKYLGSFTLLS